MRLRLLRLLGLLVASGMFLMAGCSGASPPGFGPGSRADLEPPSDGDDPAEAGSQVRSSLAIAAMAGPWEVNAMAGQGITVRAHGDAGQAITVSGPADVEVTPFSGTASEQDEVYCTRPYLSKGSTANTNCVAWLPTGGVWEVTAMPRGAPGYRLFYRIAVVDDPYRTWSPTDALYHALSQGKTALLERLIDRGADVNASTTGVDGERAPLDYAVQYRAQRGGDGEAVRLLTAAGADPNRASRYGESPWAYAVRAGDVELVRILLEGGADPSGRDLAGNPVLAIAIRDGNREIERLIRTSYSPDERVVEAAVANERFTYGDGGRMSAPALIREVYYGSHDRAQVLLEHGADPDSRECTPTYTGPIEFVSDHGCVDTTPALVLAASFGDVEMVELLLSHGAEPDAAAAERVCDDIENWGGCTKGTALMHAAILGSDVSFQIRDAYRGDAEGHWEASEGPLPIRHVDQHRGREIAALLLDYGADPNMRDEEGCTVFIYAQRAGNAELAAMLLTRGAERVATCLRGGHGARRLDAGDFVEGFRVGNIDPEVQIVDYDRSDWAVVQSIEVQEAGETTFLYEENNMRVLVGSGLVKLNDRRGVLVVTFWTQGAHSERMRVFDLGQEGGPEEKEVGQCNLVSAWSFDGLVVDEGALVVDGATQEGRPMTRRCRP